MPTAKEIMPKSIIGRESFEDRLKKKMEGFDTATTSTDTNEKAQEQKKVNMIPGELGEEHMSHPRLLLCMNETRLSHQLMIVSRRKKPTLNWHQ